MKLFISHATSDKPLADALRALITSTFAEPVEVAYSSASVSEGGISAGQDWLDWIRAQVQDSAMAIVVVTPLSKSRPWLMWEAGAVSGVGLARKTNLPVVPLLYGLRGDEVSVLAQIVSTVDLYDAVTSARPYRPALPADHAFRELRDEAARGLRDVRMVETFIDLATSGGLQPAGAPAAP